MVILAFFSIFAGFLETGSIGHIELFSGFMDKVLPAVNTTRLNVPEAVFQLLAAAVTLTGIFIAYVLFVKKPALGKELTHNQTGAFFLSGWEFDRIYNVLFVKPVVWLSEIDKKDVTDIFNISIARVTLFINQMLSLTQNGKLRWYVMAFAIGIVFIMTILMNV